MISFRLDFFEKYALDILLGLTLSLSATTSIAQDSEQIEEIEVIGITPTHGVGLPKAVIPTNVQTASGEDLDQSQSLDLTEFMHRNLGSVNVNAAQNNPLQPDVQYRGYTASPCWGCRRGSLYTRTASASWNHSVIRSIGS